MEAFEKTGAKILKLIDKLDTIWPELASH
jgi:hypothetical protein